MIIDVRKYLEVELKSYNKIPLKSIKDSLINTIQKISSSHEIIFEILVNGKKIHSQIKDICIIGYTFEKNRLYIYYNYVENQKTNFVIISNTSKIIFLRYKNSSSIIIRICYSTN